MFCTQCGRESNKVFCPFCGTRLQKEASQVKPVYFSVPEGKPAAKTEKKSKKKLFLALVLVAVFLLSAAGVFLFLHLTEKTEATPVQITAVTEETAVQMIGMVETISAMETQGADLNQIMHHIEGYSWVVNVSPTADGGLTCETEFGVTAVWRPQSISNTLPENRQQVIFEISDSQNYTYEKQQIAILCPDTSDASGSGADGYQYLGQTMAQNTDCTIEYFADGEVTLELLKRLDQFDMVWICAEGILRNIFNSTGAVIDNEPYMMIGEFVSTPEDYARLADDFFHGRIVVDLSTGRIGVGAGFYEYYYTENQLDGGFFHFGISNSMRNNTLAEALLSRGAAWVEGWNDMVEPDNDYAQFAYILDKLLDGLSIDLAVAGVSDYAAAAYDFYQTNCSLIGKGSGDYAFERTYDPYKALVGTYKGSYVAAQGETGMTLTIYMEGEGCKAIYEFYNLPGKTNAKNGSYYMDVTYLPESREYAFTSTEWIEHPTNYYMLELCGTLDGDVLSGNSPTEFTVTRIDPEAQNIPADALVFNGNYYYIYSDVCGTWEEAADYCSSLGGHLAVISSQEENDALFQYLAQCGYETAYFGYSDAENEGEWVWVTGESNSYSNFRSTEPNGGRNENYAEFYWKFDDGTWNDGNFKTGTQSDTRNFICEWEGGQPQGEESDRPEEAEINEVEIYTRWLLEGGYAELMEYEAKEKYLEISTCLIDIDRDGTEELLISLANKEFLGVRGYPIHAALLDIQDNTVKIIHQAYYTGGSMGGDYLNLKYDQKEQRYVVAASGLFRDGVYASFYYMDIFSENQQKVDWAISTNSYNMSQNTYAKEIDAIRSETDLFYEAEDEIRVYKINDQYVSDTEYAAMTDRFIDPVDPAYQMKPGTYQNPISVE